MREENVLKNFFFFFRNICFRMLKINFCVVQIPQEQTAFHQQIANTVFLWIFFS